MKANEIITGLSNLTQSEALQVVETMLLANTPLGVKLQEYITSIVHHAMSQWAAQNGAEAERFMETVGKIIQASVKEVIQQLGDSPELPLRSFYSEEQACQFFQKGPQFLKTRRSKGQSVPKHTDTGNGYIYSIAELLKFSDEIGPNYEPVSKDVLMEKGLEAVSLAVGNIGRKIEQRRKSRTPKKE